MIANAKISPTLPVVDLNRAKKFYRDTLGLKIVMEDPYGVLFESSGCNLYIYKREQTKADHTVVSFWVDDIESEVQSLRKNGIVVEDPRFFSPNKTGPRIAFVDPASVHGAVIELNEAGPSSRS